MESKIYRVIKNKYQGEYEFHLKVLKDLMKHNVDDTNILEIDHQLNYLSQLKMKMDILDAVSVVTNKDQTLLFG